jgi:hypothetical protein
VAWLKLSAQKTQTENLARPSSYALVPQEYPYLHVCLYSWLTWNLKYQSLQTCINKVMSIMYHGIRYMLYRMFQVSNHREVLCQDTDLTVCLHRTHHKRPGDITRLVLRHSQMVNITKDRKDTEQLDWMWTMWNSWHNICTL